MIFDKKNSEKSSTSHPGGNKVDGLPPALSGGYGPSIGLAIPEENWVAKICENTYKK